MLKCFLDDTEEVEQNDQSLHSIEDNLQRLKSNLEQVRKENAGLKIEIEQKENLLEAERNAMQSNVISEQQLSQDQFEPEKVNFWLKFLCLI